jgi:heme a synthase
MQDQQAERQSVPRWYPGYALGVVLAAWVLIWWGAAVTTAHVGLAVPDWPMSFGSWNPKGWWLIPGVRLEHGHRLLAGLVGLLTLGLCAGAWLGTRHRGLRVATLVAVLLVIAQGIVGGVRVLRVSDEFGIVHGCLGQSFFCLLLFILLMACEWAGPRPSVQGGKVRAWQAAGTALFAGVFIQLVLGAVLRHTQRLHLADQQLLLTGSGWFPGFSDTDLLVLFLHKWWAFVVMGIGVWMFVGPSRWIQNHRLVAIVLTLFGVGILLQVALGAGVILTGKSFWITNFHVINGQLLLACAFVLMVCAWRSVPVADVLR